MNPLQAYHGDPTTASLTAADDLDDDVLLDLDCEGLDCLKVEWLPRHDIHGRIFSGGRYVFEIGSNGTTVTIWATPEQMQAIRSAIEEEMAGEFPKQEMLDWIDRHWTYMSIHADAEFKDEEEQTYYQARLQEGTEAWEVVVASDECQEPLPEKHCRELGMAPGATFGQACAYINNRIDDAWDKHWNAGEGSRQRSMYPGFIIRKRRNDWIVREYRGKVVATCADKAVAEKVAAALSSSSRTE